MIKCSICEAETEQAYLVGKGHMFCCPQCVWVYHLDLALNQPLVPCKTCSEEYCVDYIGATEHQCAECAYWFNTRKE